MNLSRQLLLQVALTATLALQACGAPNEGELIASAKSYLGKKDAKAAVIQLKTALQTQPQSGEARYLLGKALLESGDAAAAMVELRKAADLKHPEALVAPALARAMLASGEDHKLTDSFAQVTLADASAQADLKTSVATAFARQDKRDLATAAIAEALAAAPQHAPAKIMKARMSAAARDFPAALALLDEIIAQEAGNAEAWLLKGEILQLGTRDDAAALAAYRKAVEARSDAMGAHQGIVALLLKARDVDAAQAHVLQLKKLFPSHPQTKMLEAQMAFLRKDYQATREITTPLLQLAPNNPLLLQLAGAAEFHLRAPAQAENLLATALKLAPGLPLARQLLARTYLQTGQAEKALEILRPVTEGESADPSMLTLAAEAHLHAGDVQRAEAMFKRAAKARPDDPRIRTALALSQIGKGNAAGGLAELEAVSVADEGVTANLALITTYLRRNEIDKALKAIDALEKKQVDKPLAANMRGRVLMLRRDAVGARRSFEQALAIDPLYFPAVASLAALDLTEKKPDAARKRFDDLIKAEPKNYRAMMALASLLTRTGGSAVEITGLIERAVQAGPAEPGPRLQLIEHHLVARNAKSALSVAQTAAAALPANHELVHALGRTLLASNDFQQALTTFNKLATMQPNAPQAQLGQADAHLGLKDYAGAERSLKRALEVSPKLLIAQRGLVGLMISDRRFPEALAMAKAVQKERPAEFVGYQLEGDVELQRKNWDAALSAFRAGLQKARSPEAAIKLHHALTTAGRNQEAEQFSSNWQKENARDLAFRFYLGDAALGLKDWALAESRYREVLQFQPDNAMALNNVAWLLMKQSKPGSLALAEKANALAPNQPALLDTLAMSLAADKQIDKAIALQKKNVERVPDDGGMRLNLARLHLQAGDKPQARVELERLAKLGKRFADHAEVSELLKGV